MLYARNVFIASTAVTLEIQGSTQAPVLWRGGKTTSGLAPSVGRIKSTGSCKIRKPLHTCAPRFDVTENLKIFWFLDELNKALATNQKSQRHAGSLFSCNVITTCR